MSKLIQGESEGPSIEGGESNAPWGPNWHLGKQASGFPPSTSAAPLSFLLKANPVGLDVYMTPALLQPLLGVHGRSVDNAIDAVDWMDPREVWFFDALIVSHNAERDF